jgi:hypothetical protein
MWLRLRPNFTFSHMTTRERLSGAGRGTINNHLSRSNNRERIASHLFLTGSDVDRSNVKVAKGNRDPGTCEWMLKDSRYRNWKNSTLQVAIEATPVSTRLLGRM